MNGQKIGFSMSKKRLSPDQIKNPSLEDLINHSEFIGKVQWDELLFIYFEKQYFVNKDLRIQETKLHFIEDFKASVLRKGKNLNSEQAMDFLTEN